MGETVDRRDGPAAAGGSGLTDPNWRPPVLAAARVRLRPMGAADAEGLFEYASNPAVTRFTLWDAHRTIDDTRGFIEGYARSQYLVGVPDPYGIELLETGRLVGATGARWASRDDRCMEMGYWIAEPYWGWGLAAEAGRALLGYLFAAYDVERVQAHYLDGNPASGRVLEKLGMTFEGVRRHAVFHRGRFWDIHCYAVLRGDCRGA
jgi:ribosomal-protein-alanine N-acetyltransferase